MPGQRGGEKGERPGWAWSYDTSMNILISNSEVGEDAAWVMDTYGRMTLA